MTASKLALGRGKRMKNRSKEKKGKPGFIESLGNGG